jgi:hypothetical protein
LPEVANHDCVYRTPRYSTPEANFHRYSRLTKRPCWLIVDYFPSMHANHHQHLGRTEHIVEEATDHSMKYSVH